MQNSYPEWQNFQFEPNNHCRFFFLHTLLSTIAFRLEYVVFYQFYVTITTFLDQEMFRLAPLLYVDDERFGGKWRENDIKNYIKTSKSSYWRHVWASSCLRKFQSGMQETDFHAVCIKMCSFPNTFIQNLFVFYVPFPLSFALKFLQCQVLRSLWWIWFMFGMVIYTGPKFSHYHPYSSSWP